MKHKQPSKIPELAALLVLALFAVSILLVLVTGAELYSGLTQGVERQSLRRTAVQYLSTRVRQGDGAQVADFCGTQALVLREQVEDREYLTRIYCCDGWLWELYAAEDAQMTPQDGEQLLPLLALELSQGDGMLRARLVFSDGTEQSLCWAMEEELP